MKQFQNECLDQIRKYLVQRHGYSVLFLYLWWRKRLEKALQSLFEDLQQKKPMTLYEIGLLGLVLVNKSPSISHVVWEILTKKYDSSSYDGDNRDHDVAKLLSIIVTTASKYVNKVSFSKEDIYNHQEITALDEYRVRRGTANYTILTSIVSYS